VTTVATIATVATDGGSTEGAVVGTSAAIATIATVTAAVAATGAATIATVTAVAGVQDRVPAIEPRRPRRQDRAHGQELHALVIDLCGAQRLSLFEHLVLLCGMGSESTRRSMPNKATSPQIPFSNAPDSLASAGRISTSAILRSPMNSTTPENGVQNLEISHQYRS
jgi:hypothetical protein